MVEWLKPVHRNGDWPFHKVSRWGLWDAAWRF